MSTREKDDNRAYDAIVIGAGYGGVTCAAVLAERGLRVLLVDKNARAGGKAMRVLRDGTVSELWPIAGGPTRGSRFDDLIRLVGLSPSTVIETNPTTEFRYIAPDGTQRATCVPAQPIRNPLALLRLARDFGVKPWQLGGLFRMNIQFALARGALLDRYDDRNMLDFLRDLNLPEPIHDWLASLMNLFFVVPVDELPVSEVILTMRSIAAGGAGRYHRGGYGSVAEAAVRFIQSRGGTFLSSTRVQRVLVEDERVVGIETANAVYRAPVVISNAGIQPTVLKLVGAQAFDSDYVSRVCSLRPSWAFVGVRYDLSKKIFNVPMNVVFSRESAWDNRRFAAAERGEWPRNPLLFVTVPALYDPSLASSDVPQVALVGVLCSPDPASPMNAVAIDQLEAMVDRIWPELRSCVVRRQAFGASAVSSTTRDNVQEQGCENAQGGECIGLAQIIGQCGRSKSDFRAPLSGLYYVGCDAGGRGIGTTQAVDSGYNVAAGVLADRRHPRSTSV